MGGLLAMDKPMTLPAHENRDKFCGPGRRRLPIAVGGSVVVRGADAVFTGWLRRRALAQYSRLLFSVLDDLRSGGHCVDACGPRNFQSVGAARGATRPVCRYGSDRLRRHVRDVADLAILKNVYE
jgi:hypothetical protein